MSDNPSNKPSPIPADLTKDDAKSNSPLVRSLSVDSIPSTISSFFNKRRPRKRVFEESNESDPIEISPRESDDLSDSEGLKISTSGLKTENQKTAATDRKKRKVKTKADEEFEENEKKLIAELPEDLRKYRPIGFKFNLPPTDRPIRIYADGVFDLFHLGHMKQLEQAKKSFENVQLVCGVPSDKETHKRKGLTVLTDKQRCETLLHCKWVDEVIPNAPWCVTTDFLLKHKIDYVAHDDLPYASLDSDDIYKPIKERGMFLVTQRTDGISTSDIITKVIRDYDKYLMRNFARGATRKELNVSWLKKNELEFKKHINDFRSYWDKNKTNINNVSKDLYFEVREYLRRKKSERDQTLSSTSSINLLNSDSDDISSRASSPLTEFASKYIGNRNKELNKNGTKSIFANVKEWIKIDDSHDDESAGEGSGETDLPISKRLSRHSNEPERLVNSAEVTSKSSPKKSNITSTSSNTSSNTSRKIKIPTSKKSKKIN